MRRARVARVCSAPLTDASHTEPAMPTDIKPALRLAAPALPAPENVCSAQAVVESYALGKLAALAVVYIDSNGAMGTVVDPGGDVLRLLGAMSVARADVEAELVAALNA